MIWVAAQVAATVASAACEAPKAGSRADWLPRTPTPDYDEPLPHPASDCPFYQAAWQTFLHASQPDAAGLPAFLRYAGIDDVFDPRPGPDAGSDAELDVRLPPLDVAGPRPRRLRPEIASGVAQAGLGGLLIDVHGRPIYYGTHLNDRFADFVRRHGLADAEGILGADPDLAFDDPGVVELKSAWRVLAPGDDRGTFFWKRAIVPYLVAAEGGVAPDPGGRTEVVDVALIALHVVFTLKGHPEFVWSTFEHVDRDGEPDSAPLAAGNPDAVVAEHVVDPAQSWSLYRVGSVAGNCNLGAMKSEAELAALFDEETQTFGNGVSTPVYREYPASKATTEAPDTEVEELNASVWSRFASEAPTDPRRFYRLVGATWLDRPARDFAAGRGFLNGAGQSSDDGPVAGEDALSSLAMESFTQTAYPNCFSCHDTQLVLSPDGTAIEDKAINVSRVFVRYLSGEH